MKVIEKRNLVFIISLAIILIGTVVMFLNISSGKGAFNYNVEFTGGAEIVVDIGRDFENDEITTIITESTGQANPQVQKVIGTNQVTIKTKSLDTEERKNLIKVFNEKFEIDEDAISINDISASISEEMKTTAILAVTLACIAMLIYVSLRFRDIKIGGSAIIALIHDTILVVLSYAVFRIPLNYSFIAVVLTVLGYSINATIVIFDRIRENKATIRKPDELVNISITQTFKRCMFTSLAMLILTSCLYIFGVRAIKDFALPIIIAVICGTYSSVFITGNLWHIFTIGFKKTFN